MFFIFKAINAITKPIITYYADVLTKICSMHPRWMALHIVNKKYQDICKDNPQDVGINNPQDVCTNNSINTSLDTRIQEYEKENIEQRYQYVLSLLDKDKKEHNGQIAVYYYRLHGGGYRINNEHLDYCLQLLDVMFDTPNYKRIQDQFCQLDHHHPDYQQRCDEFHRIRKQTWVYDDDRYTWDISIEECKQILSLIHNNV